MGCRPMSGFGCTSCGQYVARPKDGTPESWLYFHAPWWLCGCVPNEDSWWLLAEDGVVVRVDGQWAWAYRIDLYGLAQSA